MVVGRGALGGKLLAKFLSRGYRRVLGRGLSSSGLVLFSPLCDSVTKVLYFTRAILCPYKDILLLALPYHKPFIPSTMIISRSQLTGRTGLHTPFCPPVPCQDNATPHVAGILTGSRRGVQRSLNVVRRNTNI